MSCSVRRDMGLSCGFPFFGLIFRPAGNSGIGEDVAACISCFSTSTSSGVGGGGRWGSGKRGSAVASGLGPTSGGAGAGPSSAASLIGDGMFIIMNRDFDITGGGLSGF